MDSSTEAKTSQWKIALIVCLIVIILITAILYGFNDEATHQKSRELVEINMTSAGERLNGEVLWRHKMEDEQKVLSQKLVELTNTLTEQIKKASDNEIKSRLLQAELAALHPVLPETNTPGFAGQEHALEPTLAQPVVLIKKVTLNLTEPKTSPPAKTILDTIPAGAFASAVTLSGMDASSAMNAASNPIPLLLRLIHPGTLPRQFKSDLEDCHCTASGYGDVSSERVHVRLEKLTCIERATGEIISTSVAGYVAGPDGREGIRGTLVSKEGQYLSRSAIGGLLSGFSSIASPAKRQGMANPLGIGAAAPSMQSLFQSGFLEGTGGSLDKLSQYYINRAEQLQPVVQVPGGQVVDIVFTEPAGIGETRVKEAIAAVRTEARDKLIENVKQQEQKMGNHPWNNGGALYENP